MKTKALLLLLLLIATTSARPVEYSELTPDGGQRFGHDSGPGGFHHANLSPHGSVRGSFGHTEPRSGQSFRTEYSAGRAGFIAQGAHITRRGEDLGLNARLDIPNSKIPPPSRAYDFSWNSADQSRREAVDALGDVRGRYSYVDDVGIRRTVDYIAGQQTGFLVTNDVPDPAVSGPAAEAAYYRPSRRGAPPGPAGTRGYQSTKINADGSYRFTHSSPAQRRTERKDALGRVLGEYSYIDDRGSRHRIQYEAGPGIGFRITGREPAAPGSPNLRPIGTPLQPGPTTVQPPIYSPSTSTSNLISPSEPQLPPGPPTSLPPIYSTPGSQTLRPPGAPSLRPPGAPTLRPPGAPALRPPGAPALRPPGAPVLRPPGAPILGSPTLRPPGAPLHGAPTLRPPGASTPFPSISPTLIPPVTPLRPFDVRLQKDEESNRAVEEADVNSNNDDLNEGSAATLAPEFVNERRARLRGQSQESNDDWVSANPTTIIPPFASTSDPSNEDNVSINSANSDEAFQSGVTLEGNDPPIEVLDLSHEEARDDETWRRRNEIPSWLPDMQEDPRAVNEQLHVAATTGDEQPRLDPRFDWQPRVRSPKRTWSWINEPVEDESQNETPSSKEFSISQSRSTDDETRLAESAPSGWRSERQHHGGSLVTSSDLRYLRSRINSNTPRLAQVVSLD